MSSTASHARGKSQVEIDLERLLDLGGGNDLTQGVQGFIVELAEAGVRWNDIAIRLTEAGHLYGRTCTYGTAFAVYDTCHEWALGEVEREQRRRPGSEQEATNSGLVVVNVAELLSREIPARKTLLTPIMAEASISMLHGPRGLGKTTLALGKAVALASGGTFLRWPAPEPVPVLYVDGELPLVDLRARAARAIEGASTVLPDPNYLQFLTPDLQEQGIPDLSTSLGQAALEPFLQDRRALFLDNISTLFHSGVENEAESWSPVQHWLLDLRRRNIASELIHHSGKSGLQRGTSRREDVLDTVIGLRRPSDYREADGCRCEVHFEKHRGFHGDDAEPFEAQLATDEDGRQVWTVKDLDDRKTERVADMLNDGEKVRDIAKALGIGLATVDRHKKKAINRGLLDAN